MTLSSIVVEAVLASMLMPLAGRQPGLHALLRPLRFGGAQQVVDAAPGRALAGLARLADQDEELVAPVAVCLDDGVCGAADDVAEGDEPLQE
jgi:hypothetical protein